MKEYEPKPNLAEKLGHPVKKTLSVIGRVIDYIIYRDPDDPDRGKPSGTGGIPVSGGGSGIW